MANDFSGEIKILGTTVSCLTIFPLAGVADKASVKSVHKNSSFSGKIISTLVTGGSVSRTSSIVALTQSDQSLHSAL